MPHCGRRLYENVLRSNWDRSSLSQLAIVGNPIVSMRRDSINDAIRISAPLLHEFSLPAYEDRPDAFSDTSVQYFSSDHDDSPALPRDSDVAFWSPPLSSPETNDPEIR